MPVCRPSSRRQDSRTWLGPYARAGKQCPPSQPPHRRASARARMRRRANPVRATQSPPMARHRARQKFVRPRVDRPLVPQRRTKAQLRRKARARCRHQTSRLHRRRPRQTRPRRSGWISPHRGSPARQLGLSHIGIEATRARITAKPQSAAKPANCLQAEQRRTCAPN